MASASQDLAIDPALQSSSDIRGHDASPQDPKQPPSPLYDTIAIYQDSTNVYDRLPQLRQLAERTATFDPNIPLPDDATSWQTITKSHIRNSHSAAALLTGELQEETALPPSYTASKMTGAADAAVTSLAAKCDKLQAVVTELLTGQQMLFALVRRLIRDVPVGGLEEKIRSAISCDPTVQLSMTQWLVSAIDMPASGVGTQPQSSSSVKMALQKTISDDVTQQLALAVTVRGVKRKSGSVSPDKVTQDRERGLENLVHEHINDAIGITASNSLARCRELGQYWMTIEVPESNSGPNTQLRVNNPDRPGEFVMKWRPDWEAKDRPMARAFINHINTAILASERWKTLKKPDTDDAYTPAELDEAIKKHYKSLRTRYRNEHKVVFQPPGTSRPIQTVQQHRTGITRRNARKDRHIGRVQRYFESTILAKVKERHRFRSALLLDKDMHADYLSDDGEGRFMKDGPEDLDFDERRGWAGGRKGGIEVRGPFWQSDSLLMARLVLEESIKAKSREAAGNVTPIDVEGTGGANFDTPRYKWGPSKVTLASLPMLQSRNVSLSSSSPKLKIIYRSSVRPDIINERPHWAEDLRDDPPLDEAAQYTLEELLQHSDYTELREAVMARYKRILMTEEDSPTREAHFKQLSVTPLVDQEQAFKAARRACKIPDAEFVLFEYVDGDGVLHSTRDASPDR